MEHIWSVLCQSSLIDKDTNSLSLNNILERLVLSVEGDNTKKSLEVNIPIVYELVSMWSKHDLTQKIDAEILLEIIDPKSTVLKSFNQKVEMPVNMSRLRTRFRIQGLGLTISGIYKFVIKIKEPTQKEFRKVSEIPLEVYINTAQRTSSSN